jgi:hypothetical protein
MFWTSTSTAKRWLPKGTDTGTPFDWQVSESEGRDPIFTGEGLACFHAQAALSCDWIDG